MSLDVTNPIHAIAVAVGPQRGRGRGKGVSNRGARGAAPPAVAKGRGGGRGGSSAARGSNGRGRGAPAKRGARGGAEGPCGVSRRDAGAAGGEVIDSEAQIVDDDSDDSAPAVPVDPSINNLVDQDIEMGDLDAVAVHNPEADDIDMPVADQREPEEAELQGGMENLTEFGLVGDTADVNVEARRGRGRGRGQQ